MNSLDIIFLLEAKQYNFKFVDGQSRIIQLVKYIVVIYIILIRKQINFANFIRTG